MRVVLNQVSALGLKAGIGHYAHQLYCALRKHAHDVDSIESYPTGWVRKVCDFYSRSRPRLDSRRSQYDVRRSRSVGSFMLGGLHQIGFRVVANRFRAQHARRHYQLYHEPNFIPLPCDVPTLATIHDLSLLLHPQWHTPERVAHFHRHVDRALRQCTYFISGSEAARREAIKTLSIPPERITRIYHGIREDLGPQSPAVVKRTLDELGLPRHYLLYVGTIEPRKNLLNLLKAYCGLPANYRSRYPLLLIGKWGWNAKELVDSICRLKEKGVIHAGYVPDRHLAAVYSGARALVYPSRYEGFGLPPLEMMACGGAVLASTADAIVETVGRKACLLDPDDVDGWRKAMARVIADQDWWRSLRYGTLDVARPFTWDRCALETLTVYRKLCAPEKKRVGRAA